MALFALSAVCAPAQADKFGKPFEKAAPGNANQAEGARVLAEFQQASIAGDYWLSFELRVLPRKGAERILTGALLGSSGRNGPLSRISLDDGRWLVESGPEPSAWTLKEGVVESASPGESLGDTGVTIFDLQMPFLYWKDFTYEGHARLRGRATHSFVLRPPPGQAMPEPGLTGVRVFLDTQFVAMVQAEVLGENNAVVKTIALLDLKKVGDQYLPKSLDVRDHRTRDKTRFTVRAAALDLRWPAGVFSPEGLTTEAPPVPGEKVVRF